MHREQRVRGFEDSSIIISDVENKRSSDIPLSKISVVTPSGRMACLLSVNKLQALKEELDIAIARHHIRGNRNSGTL